MTWIVCDFRDIQELLVTMAARPSGYGLTAELDRKKADKYDVNLEKAAREWVEAVVGEKLNPSELGADNMHEALKSGAVLVKLANKLTGSSIKVNESKMAFKQMENIGKFLDAMDAYGLNSFEKFQTVDLYEATNMTQVVLSLHAIGRLAVKKGFNGPAFKTPPT